MILVTGGTGTSGSEIVKQLAAAGAKFRAMARNPGGADSLRLPGVEVVAGDFERPESLDAALRGVSKALLLTPPDERQVEQQARFVDAAKRAGVRHVVKFSAAGADPASPARFLRQHGEADRAIQSSGLAWTFLRPPFFMQNLLGLAGMVKGGTLYQPAGEGRAAFVDVRDIAAVAVNALTQDGHEGKAYEVTGPRPLSHHDIAAALSSVLGREVKYANVPPEAARQAMLGAGMGAWQVEGILELYALLREGKFERATDVVKRVAGREPTTIEQFIRDHRGSFA
jgi:uncharacterized protein YbjT (DUF2867 family)